MSKAPQQRNTEVIEGELVESTERALMNVTANEATIDSSMVAILTKAELDQMVVTARANPRSVQRAMENTKEIACLTAQSAAECGYAVPRGRDEQTGKANVITGPSIRLAEIVACQWGNCQAAARVTDINRAEGWVEAEGVFIDFQTNYRVTMRTRRSIRGKSYQGKPGKVFGDDMINVTSNAAQAIAFRNAVFKGVPKPIWQAAYEETQRIVRGDEKSLGARRVDLLTAFKDKLGVAPEKVYAILGVKGERDIGLDELVTAAGFFSAIKNNEITVEDLIRQITPTVAPAKGLGQAFDATGAKAQPPHDPDTGEVKEEPKPKAEPAPKVDKAPPPAEEPAAAGPDLDDLPDADPEEEQGEDDEDEPAGDDGPEDAQGFVDYFESLPAKDSWLTIKAAYSALRKTPAYTGASKELQHRALAEAVARTEALRAEGKEPVSPKTDPAYYGHWVQVATAAEVAETWGPLSRSPAYGKLTEDQKENLALATAAAKEREA